MSKDQERWDVYVVSGTREVVRQALEPDESLSEFVRVAIAAELERRELLDA
jgi:hypothetical protein